MRYHFVVNGYTEDVQRQMEEQAGFAGKYLAGLEEGEAFICLRRAEDIQKMKVHHSKEALLIPAPEYVPEIVLEVLCSQADKEDLYIFGSDDCGTELAVRMAARLSGSSVTEAEKIYLAEEAKESAQTAQEKKRCLSGETDPDDARDQQVFVSKMVYANHMEAVFEMRRGPYCVSLARGGERQGLIPGAFAVREEKICENAAGHIVSQEFCPEDAGEGLENAKVILAAGRGVKNKENMAVIDEAARQLKAEVAVSRPAAMNAWKPMNRLIGVSGAMAGPDICITAGISGAAAFYAGIEKSGFIAAINTDEKAPIMKMADVAIIDDFLPVMEELRNICK